MNTLWSVYHPDIPDFLRRSMATPPMLRLRDVGMNCGCEYTSFPRFAHLEPYSRYDHSVGVALIVWHFTGSVEQSLAGLFHDISTPVFAHVVDFLNGDHVRQESTEQDTGNCLAASPEILELLETYGLTVEQVADYHQYPVADNDSPALSADRLEYTLGNLLNYGFADLKTLRRLYEDLTVGTDEHGTPELTFRTPEIAAEFARLALQTARVYVADEDRFAMQALADLLRQAIDCGCLQRSDLMKTEPEVIRALTADPKWEAEWERFCRYACMLRSDSCPETGYWVRVDAKKRWIDPLAQGCGRVSRWHETARREMEAFQALDFSPWLSAK